MHERVSPHSARPTSSLYETLRDDFEAALEINGGETRRLAAAKAILLLRPSRLAIEKAVAAGSKEQARRARRR